MAVGVKVDAITKCTRDRIRLARSVSCGRKPTWVMRLLVTFGTIGVLFVAAGRAGLLEPMGRAGNSES